MNQLTLGEVGHFIAGTGFPIKLQGKKSGKYPFAKVGDISKCARAGFYSLLEADNWVDESAVESLRAKIVPKDSILFAKIGEAIRQNFRVFSGREILIDNNAMAFVPDNKKLNPIYAYQFLKTIDLYAFTSKTSVPSIRKSVLESIPIPLPPLQEQKRIAAILDKADALREKRRQAIAKLDELLQSVFLDMFGDPVTNPMGWALTTLPEISVVLTDGPFGSNLKSSHYVDNGVRVIRLQNIGRGEMLDDDLAYISQDHFASLPRNHCKPGDVIIGTLGDPNLRACIIPIELKDSLNKADCILLRLDSKKALSSYVCWLLNCPATVMKALELVRGQTRGRISLGRLKQLEVPLPPLSIQSRFSTIAESIKRQKVNLYTHLSEIETLFKSFQSRAFKGEL